MNSNASIFSLADEVALVTGASRGIGAEIAACLSEAGATVVGTATSDEGAERINNRFKETGCKGAGMVLDVNQPDQVTACLDEISGEHGPVTVLVNNAGVTRDSLLMRMKPDDWNAVIATDLSSVYYTSRACLRGMMKKRHGRIINVGSVVGSMGNPGQANYAAAKAGIVGFSKSLAREVGSRGVTVNVVAPGFISTDMTEQLGADQTDALVNAIPLGRLGETRDVSAVVWFLASPAGAYITGETIHVNGGMYMS